jgi:hypothetical protein
LFLAESHQTRTPGAATPPIEWGGRQTNSLFDPPTGAPGSLPYGRLTPSNCVDSSYRTVFVSTQYPGDCISPSL